MKRFFFLLMILFMSINCHQPLPPEFENQPPNEPMNIYPANDTTDIPLEITFLWTVKDPNATDTLTYDFYLEADNPAPKLIVSGLTVDSLHYNALDPNTRYYWKVVAHDQKGASASSTVWTFRTRYGSNDPPYTPANPQPENNATAVPIDSVELKWTGGDPDSFSIVTYDVLFGTNADSLAIIAENQSNSSYAFSLLNYGTQYFWQIIAKDNYGSTSAGPVWNFETVTGLILFYDNFDTGQTNQNPPSTNWDIMESSADIFITDEVVWNGQGKSVCFVDSTEAGSSYLATRLPTSQIGMVQFYWRISTINDFIGVRLYSQFATKEYLGPELSVRNGQLQYYANDHTWKTVCSIETNQWYFIQLYFDCNRQFYNIYVDEELKSERATWQGSSVANIDLIYFLTFENRRCQKAYLDEITYITNP